MTPVIVVLYLAADRTTPPRESMDFVAHYMLKGNPPEIKSGQQEQALTRKVLFQNSQRLSPDFKPARQECEIPFKVSFFLPLNPLSQTDIGTLLHTGCEVCGKKTVSRCSQCLSASYCSSGKHIMELLCMVDFC